MIAFMVFFCCCGIDTSTVAGSASQVNQQYETEEELQDADGHAMSYVLNTNTMKFHYPDCRSVKQMKDKNKEEIEATREEIIERGFSPCGNCNP